MSVDVLTRLAGPRRRVSAFQGASFTLIAAVGVMVGYPFLKVVVSLFIVDGAPSFEPIRRAFASDGIGEVLKTSVIVVFAAGILAVIIGSLMAWLNERTDARIPGVTDFVPLMPFLLPGIAFAIGWVLLLSPGAGILNVWIRDFLGLFGVEATRGPLNIYTMYGLIFCYFNALVPYAFLFVSAGLRNMPADLEEQARVAGAGRFKTFWRVTLPAMRPSVSAAAVMLIWFGFAMFSIPFIIGTGGNIEVLTVRIVRLINFTYPPQTDLAVSLSLFILLFVGGAWLIQLRIMKSATFVQIGGRGARGTTVRLGWGKWPARALMIGFLLVSGVLPMVGLLLTALQGFWSQRIDLGNLGFDSFKRVWQDEHVIDSFRNSLVLAAITATGIIVFAALMSTYMRRHGGVVSRILEGAIRLPVVVSGFVLIIGMILAYSGAPFYLQGSFLLFVIAYMAMTIPQASIIADAAAAQVSDSMSEAAAVSGAKEGKIFRKILVPLMIPGLVAGWTLVFVHVAGDMEVAAMLASNEKPVVGYAILQTFNAGKFADLAAIAVTLVLVSAACIGLGNLAGYFLSGHAGLRKSKKAKKA
ncbi:iron ABC transporter permease [Streptomyces sp. NPDC050625]|uniref:ABC transporter permease n=1 Tax=Streptomyces sp. NPDC050625 TaxID=3154629 RepID=UPI00343D870F